MLAGCVDWAGDTGAGLAAGQAPARSLRYFDYHQGRDALVMGIYGKVQRCTNHVGLAGDLAHDLSNPF